MFRFILVLLPASAAIAAAAVTCSAFVGNTALRSPFQYSHSGKRWPITQTDGGRACSHTAVEESVELRTLYPSLAPYRNGTLAVDDTHTLCYQEYGQPPTNEKALTALFLHGGPGAGCSPNHSRFFDSKIYRIVLLDQRGSGRSTPLGEAFEKNTLQNLVQDCEKLREELDIARWDLVLGGSWGSTLALAYAQAFPDSVRSLVLRGDLPVTTM